LHSKHTGLLFSHIIIIVAITVIVLIANDLLQAEISNHYLRGAILIVLATSLYYFIAPSILEPYLQTDEKLKEMVSHTLHELNTPIATIKANISLLQRSIKDEKSRQRLARISNASENLTKLYESIEYNIKENIEYIEKAHFSLSEIIDESIAKFEEIKGNIQIYNATENFPLFTDKNGFERIIDNLLSNAIKYNKEEGYVRFYTKDSRLFVEDSGIGIDPKNLFIVYEKSFQENPSTIGYGLGLSIVKNFCDREKITIKIDTQKHKGTTISLELENIIDK